MLKDAPVLCGGTMSCSQWNGQSGVVAMLCFVWYCLSVFFFRSGSQWILLGCKGCQCVFQSVFQWGYMFLTHMNCRQHTNALMYVFKACCFRVSSVPTTKATVFHTQSFRDAGPDPHRIAHAVDIHLERWQSAMDHLMAVDDLDAALALATAHGLLRALLTALPTISPRRNDVLNAYAASLEAKHRHEDAALAYLAAGESQHAQRAYRAAGCWQQVLACAAANAASEGPPDVARLASDIAAELSTMHRPLEAAQVLLDYCDDAEGGVLLLCEGQAWREAVRQAHRAGRGDLVETVIVPAAAGRAAAVLGAAGDALARVDKYLERWRGVRDKRRALQV